MDIDGVVITKKGSALALHFLFAKHYEKLRENRDHMKLTLQKLKRMLLVPVMWLATAVFLIEESIWDLTAAIMARLGAGGQCCDTFRLLREFIVAQGGA